MDRMVSVVLFWTALIILARTDFAFGSEKPGCPESDFVPCVTRLRLKRVTFDKNMLNVVFNVTSEAKLRHTCLAYNDVVPCFRDRILRCGNEKQKRMLDEVVKMVRFFCSSMSKEKQKLFLKHVQCVGQLLQQPASSSCNWETHPESAKIMSCRQECNARKEFFCMMRVWVSEQSLCTLVDIEQHCDQEAAQFYIDLQRNVFNDDFPIVCEFSVSSLGQVANRNSLSPKMEYTSPANSMPIGLHPNSNGVLTRASGGITVYFLQTTTVVTPTTVATSQTTDLPWWLQGSFQTNANVYNPGETLPSTTTMVVPTVSGELTSTSSWRKWLEIFLPTTTSVSSLPSSSPSSNVWSQHRRPPHPHAVYETDHHLSATTWKPWYLGGGAHPGPQHKSGSKAKNQVPEFDLTTPDTPEYPRTYNAYNKDPMEDNAKYIRWSHMDENAPANIGYSLSSAFWLSVFLTLIVQCCAFL